MSIANPFFQRGQNLKNLIDILHDLRFKVKLFEQQLLDANLPPEFHESYESAQDSLANAFLILFEQANLCDFIIEFNIETIDDLLVHCMKLRKNMEKDE